MKKRGRGVGCMFYGIGNTGSPNPASATAEILEDGEVIVRTGCADLGQGSSTVLAQIVAEELGIDVGSVALVTADTATTPEAGVTAASRATYVVGNAVRLAAREAKRRLLDECAAVLEASVDELEASGGRIYVRGEANSGVSFAQAVDFCRKKGVLLLGSGCFNPVMGRLDPHTGEGSPYGTYAFATHIAEVEVDTETGYVEVLRIVAANDVGRAINPATVEGQMEGGCVMGMGYALMEEAVVQEGTLLADSFGEYLIPTTLDVGELDTIIVEDPEPTGPFGAKGVAEPALIPTAPAIVGAVYDAIGVMISDLPLTPEKVLAALQRKEDGAESVQ
jgi:CO/xanthine dehydrogenase Mo-binding subunit